MPSSGSSYEAGAHVGHVLVDPRHRAVTDRDHAVLLALALPHHDRAAFHVEVEETQADHLHAPDTRRVQRLQDRTVAHAEFLVHVGLVHDLLGFGGREHVLGQALLKTRQVEFARGIREQHVLSSGKQPVAPSSLAPITLSS